MVEPMWVDAKVPSGYHISEYAGISIEEREGVRSLRCELDAQREYRSMFLDYLDSNCAQCAPRFEISDILDAKASWDVTAVAKGLGVRKRPFESHSHLASRVVADLKADEDLVHACVTPLSMNMLDGLRALYECGGRMTIDIDASLLPLIEDASECTI